MAASNTNGRGSDCHSVWVFCDGRPGHQNQSLGLLDRLNELQPLNRVEMTPLPMAQALMRMGLGFGTPAAWRRVPPPALVLGAGHDTHLSLLAAKRIFSCPAVVIMRPSLPLSWFDACLIPEHDDPPARANVIATRGALNRMVPSAHQCADHGLFLIGGPSRHHGWDDAAMVEQIRDVALADSKSMPWTLTTSRRTPASFLELLRQQPFMAEDRVMVVPAEQTSARWVAEQLAVCERAWASEDSVSMVCEALTAGACVGVLEVPARRASVRRELGLQWLVDTGHVTLFTAWNTTRTLPRAPQPLHEAARCAAILYERFFAKT